MLIDHGVDAIGVNFWSGSKRFLPPSQARHLLEPAANRILRVGVFVNPGRALPQQLYDNGLIDVIQLHGDEPLGFAIELANSGAPVIKAFNIEAAAQLVAAKHYGIHAALLDTPAPGSYGGTGKTFDWQLALDFKAKHPSLPLILAGGITTANIADGIATVQPAAIDLASGAESAPGIKDPSKVEKLMQAIHKAAKPKP